MVRKQLYIDDAQDLFLQIEAERSGMTQAEVVRRAIDAFQLGVLNDRRGQALARIRKAWADIDQRYAQLRETGVATPFYEFKREDAYEDRLKRYDR